MAQTETAEKLSSAPTSEPPPPPKKSKGGRPPAGTDRIPRVLSFFDKVAQIPAEDWGPRARIKIYRTEPHIDRVSLGKKRYVRDSLAPIDEDAIKRAAWGGSGSYRLYLTYKAPQEREGKEIDSIEVDILDTEYPPRLEPGEWLDIPENAKWKWAKALLETPPVAAPTPMSSIVEVMNATNEIRRTAIEEMRQHQPSAPTTDPMVTAMTLAEKLLTLRTDNPMVAMMAEQLTAMRQELSEQRQRGDKLLEKLAEKNKEPEAKADPLVTIKSIFDTFKSVREQAQEVLPSGNGGRSRLSPWMEFFQPVLPSVVEMLKPVAVAVAQSSLQPNPPNGQRQQIQQPPDFSEFLHAITPRMLHFIREYAEPAPAFAAWLHDGYGATAQRAIDTIGTMGGIPSLVAWYRTSKYWPTLAPIEAEFTEFLNAVYVWRPKEDEPEAPAPEDTTEEPVIDLEAEEVNHGN